LVGAGGVVGRDAGSFAGQLGEDHLGDMLGERSVTDHLSQGRRIDQVEVFLHQLGEGSRGGVFDLPPE